MLSPCTAFNVRGLARQAAIEILIVHRVAARIGENLVGGIGPEFHPGLDTLHVR